MPAVMVVVAVVEAFVLVKLHPPPTPVNESALKDEEATLIIFPAAVEVNWTVPLFELNAPLVVVQLPPIAILLEGSVTVPVAILKSFVVVPTPAVVHAPFAPLNARL